MKDFIHSVEAQAKEEVVKDIYSRLDKDYKANVQNPKGEIKFSMNVIAAYAHDKGINI